nr:thiamine phosphate synthase [Desulfobacterales bacterium]
MNRKERLARLKQIDIYPVTCERLSEGRTNLEVLDAVLAGGAKIIQLREKDWGKKDLYELAIEFRKRTLRHNALLIINDHVDVALAAGADGVHLGQEDLPITVARKIGPDLILGASSHSLQEALQAEEDGADYVNIGPIFPTKTKNKVSRFLGPNAIREIGPRLRVPFTTMGGINQHNIHLVLEAGARRIAMVTGITQAPDIAKRVRELKKIILSYL